MKITVLIPTYRRPDCLTKCLQALARQLRAPDQMLVVVRDCDETTRVLFQRLDFRIRLLIDVITVDEAGQVAALNAGLAHVTGDIVAITDDDTAPRPDWLQRIEEHFTASPSLAGVGGRDFVHDGRIYPDARIVGKVQWFGRRIGNHHRGVGDARDVDILKGANMSYRMSALGSRTFDTRLRGAGAQVHNDLCFSLQLRRAGWRILYDPAVAVDHFSSLRFEGDGREHRSREGVVSEAHNETLAILEYLSLSRWLVFLGWSVLIGHRRLPGIAQCVRLAILRYAAWQLFIPVLIGRWLGLKTVLEHANSKRHNHRISKRLTLASRG